jgi:hypothetical protein
MKKIFVIASVKNESDIIESFCRYSLGFCDGMLIYENDKSSDNTREIIQKLIDEGLPIFFEDDEEMYYEAAKSVLVDLAFGKYDADLIVPLDADEFLYHTDKVCPRDMLESLCKDVEYQIPWRTYIYEKEPCTKPAFVPSGYEKYRNPLLEDAQGHAGTVLLSKFLYEKKGARLVYGAHWLVYPEEHQGTVAIENPKNVVCAHFPIRSRIQIMRKAIPNWINKWRMSNRASREHLDKFQLGFIFNEICHHGEISTKKMRLSSIEYSLYGVGDDYMKARLMLELGDQLVLSDPMDSSFYADKIKLRYTDFGDDSKVFLRATLRMIDSTVTFLSAESDEKSRVINELTYDKEILAEQHEELIRNCEGLEEHRDALNRQVSEILSSRSWKIAHRLSKIYSLLVFKKRNVEAVATPSDHLDSQSEPSPTQKTDYPNYDRNASIAIENYPEALGQYFMDMKNETLDLANPKTYCEKIQWMKLYDNDMRKTRLTDKYMVREWVASTIGEQYLIPIYGAWNKFDEIDFNELPDKFVLKANHGCGWNIIVRNKAELDISDAREKMEYWLSLNFSFCAYFELHYRGIKPKIIAEEYIENIDEDVFDYKVFCFNGRAEYIQFLTGRHTSLKRAFFDRNWNLQPFVTFHPRYDGVVAKPDCLDELIRLAEKLSAGFAHVRVDFYILNSGEIKFGEMTFTPASGFFSFDPPEYDCILGDLLILPFEKED